MVKDPLRDVEEFVHLGMEERRRLARTIADKLGEGWSAEEPSEELDGLPLHHQPTGLSFVVVPGGEFEMGLTEGDLAELRAYAGPELEAECAAYLESQSDDMRPVHRVRVNPFIVAQNSLLAEDVERLSGGRFHGIYCYSIGWNDARQLAASHDLRLASEAEYEWLARDGGRTHFTLDAVRKLEEIKGNSRLLQSRFGVSDLFEDQWTEDDYHPSYEGAPETSIPWMSGTGTGAARGGVMPEIVEEPHQSTGLLAAMRSNETQGTACVRFARDLPDLDA